MKNLYCETDPFLVIDACCYVAAKAEESPVNISVSESHLIFNLTRIFCLPMSPMLCNSIASAEDGYRVKTFPSDT